MGYLFNESGARRIVQAVRTIERSHGDELSSQVPEQYREYSEIVLKLKSDFGTLGVAGGEVVRLGQNGLFEPVNPQQILGIWNPKTRHRPAMHIWSGFAFEGEYITATWKRDRLWATGCGWRFFDRAVLQGALAAGNTANATVTLANGDIETIEVGRRGTLTGDNITQGTTIGVEYDDVLGWVVVVVPC